jgi:uncharacterized membrane protein YeaQ/YmgE (transglycosylase-associated protein family)
MSWIILIIVGGIIGYIASLIAKTNARQGWLADIIIGIVGALLGKWIFADLLGIGSAAAAGTLTFAGILWGIVGAVILILILRALRLY